MNEYSVEVVRGRLSEERARRILAFWAGRDALPESEARRRLDDVVCVLVDGQDEVAGVNSVFAAPVSLVGGRPFWVYRSLVAPEAADSARDLLRTAFTALEAEFDPTAPGPLGLCLVLDGPEAINRNPELEWSDPRLLYVGYRPDGRQVRVGYFAGASLAPGPETPPIPAEGWALEEGYGLSLYAEQDRIGEDDVMELWTTAARLSEEEARRRLDEVLLVATDPDGGLAGLLTAYLHPVLQLELEMWNVRGFVAEPHRTSSIGFTLLLAARDHLRGRFASGEDTRAAGILIAIENRGLLRRFPQAVWPHADFTFVGERPDGAHLRVHYFPGAKAPLP